MFRDSPAHWLAFFRPGDWLVLLAALLWVGVSFPLLWQGGKGERAIIRQQGKVFMELALDKDRELRVPGPLGETQIVIANGQARVAADPGPRQYCVRQGWLSQAGEIAICAPNQVSLAIVGNQEAPYDSLNY
ncbi:MAG: NusG domain II-containing protein [Zoogloeaceae bacterium]|nr:NusG domain II-containing protein [Zoogloeaceae bacterium]